jgi:hypothetical protein
LVTSAFLYNSRSLISASARSIPKMRRLSTICPLRVLIEN